MSIFNLSKKLSMIKNITTSLFACALLLLTGCDKYLDIPPVGSVIPNTATEYRALLATAYRDVPSTRGLAAFRSDELTLTSTSEWDLNSFADIERWNDAQPALGTTPFHWVDFYSVIFVANYTIENAKKITEGTPDVINQLVGEAYLLRGYMHFLLVNLYGQPYSKPGAPQSKAVPLKLNSDVTDILSRNTVEEVYASIASDISNAEKLINKDAWEIQFSYRFNVASVHAFRSRLALYMEQWKTALSAAEAAMQSHAELESLNASTPLLPNHYKSVEAIAALENVLISNYQNAVSLSASLLAKYDLDTDLRLTSYYAQPDSRGNRKPLKGGKPEFRSTFRAGEVYLNAAEAAAQLGETAKAKQYLLKLMQARFTPEGYAAKESNIALLSGSELLNEIYDERARELAFEGHRWFDLRRTTRPTITKTLKLGTYILLEDDPRYTIPIPKEAIASNPNLTN